MKNLGLLGLIVLLALAAGCASSKQPNSDAPDGIFTSTTDDALGYKMTVFPPKGGPAMTVAIQEYGGFLPQHVTVVLRPRLCLIQITGQGLATNWSDQGLFVVANHVPYWQLKKSPQKAAVPGKSAAVPAAIFMTTRSPQEANSVAAALRKRYSLPAEPDATVDVN